MGHICQSFHFLLIKFEVVGDPTAMLLVCLVEEGCLSQLDRSIWQLVSYSESFLITKSLEQLILFVNCLQVYLKRLYSDISWEVHFNDDFRNI